MATREVCHRRDLFAKKVAVEPKKENGKKRVKKVREETGEDGFSCGRAREGGCVDIEE